MAEYEQPLFGPEEGHMRKSLPVQSIADSAKAYDESWYNDDLGHVSVRGTEGGAAFQEYKRRASQDPSPETIKSYESLRGHISQQFDILTRPREQGGAGINVEVTDTDPYESYEDMYRDVSDNSRLRVLSTGTTGSHSFFTDEENDKFRAVHDAYGHLATGRDFSRHGEEAAYRSHRRMLPKEAHAALASETRGQNSFLNWGGGGFPENKMVNLPDWMTGEDIEPPAQKKPTKSNDEQLTLW